MVFAIEINQNWNNINLTSVPKIFILLIRSLKQFNLIGQYNRWVYPAMDESLLHRISCSCNGWFLTNKRFASIKSTNSFFWHLPGIWQDQDPSEDVLVVRGLNPMDRYIHQHPVRLLLRYVMGFWWKPQEFLFYISEAYRYGTFDQWVPCHPNHCHLSFL